MTYLHATLMASALAVSSSAYAYQSCNVNLSAGFTINTTAIEFIADGESSDNKRSLYKIVEGKKLYIAEQVFILSHSQQALVKEYDAKIRHLVPQVKTVAIEGIDLAVDGVNVAFNDLLGEGNSVAADLTKELTLIRQQVAANLSIEKGISIGVEGLESESLLGKDFEQRIESVVQKAVVNSMGSILMSMGQQMMAAEGSGESFETRMEKFAQRIEDEMNMRTSIIAKDSQALCESITQLDDLEEQLKSNIKPLSTINVFTVTK